MTDHTAELHAIREAFDLLLDFIEDNEREWGNDRSIAELREKGAPDVAKLDAAIEALSTLTAFSTPTFDEINRNYERWAAGSGLDRGVFSIYAAGYRAGAKR